MAELKVQSLFDFEPEAPARRAGQLQDERRAPESSKLQPEGAEAPRAVLTAELRAGYLEQVVRDEQTLRLGLCEPWQVEFYRERIAAYKGDLC